MRWGAHRISPLLQQIGLSMGRTGFGGARGGLAGRQLTMNKITANLLFAICASFLHIAAFSQGKYISQWQAELPFNPTCDKTGVCKTPGIVVYSGWVDDNAPGGRRGVFFKSPDEAALWLFYPYYASSGAFCATIGHWDGAGNCVGGADPQGGFVGITTHTKNQLPAEGGLYDSYSGVCANTCQASIDTRGSTGPALICPAGVPTDYVGGLLVYLRVHGGVERPRS